MKLSTNAISDLTDLLSATSLVKIDSIIIEKDFITGIDTEKSVVVTSDSKIPDFGETKIGLNRLDILAKRMNLIREAGNGEFEIKTEVNGSGDAVSKLDLTATGTSVQFRTADPSKIRSPRGFNDSPTWLVQANKEAILTAVKAAATMGSDEIVISAKGNGEVYFELVDEATRDTFSTKIADAAIWIPEDQEAPKAPSFVHYYLVKSLIPLLKFQDSDQVSLVISPKGLLQIDINGYTFTVLPRVGG